jgi:RNA polymerase sigma-70 factor, ECF subfamily
MDVPRDLVDRARRGDRDAFAAIYDATARPLYLYAVAIARRTEDAEDAIHAAYLSAWRALPSLRDAARFLPWLFRIARNAARDHARGEPRRDAMPGDLPAPPLDDARPLAELLEGLDEPTRALLTLRYGVAWDVDEIARVTATSPATVRRRLARAEQHLRERERGRTADVR